MGKTGPNECDAWISVTLTCDQCDRLDDFAAFWNISRSEAVRWLIDYYVPPLIRAPEAGGGSAMKSDIAGCSTCPPGQERYETFWSSLRGGERMVKYDYRTADGTLFSCIGRSLGGCRLGRDLWLERRQVHQEVET